MEIDVLEKVAALQILVILYTMEEEIYASGLVDSVNAGHATAYSAIRKLIENRFIQEEWKSNPRRRILSLTEKGRVVAEKLAEAEQILKTMKGEKNTSTLP